ncbi:MAG: N-acetylmuramoyl-L-alanine amidase [Bacteroidota bacterium]|nr:N-acetylmuramoyl-L-alanine amidase [Bacteroidota bacterium]
MKVILLPDSLVFLFISYIFVRYPQVNDAGGYQNDILLMCVFTKNVRISYSLKIQLLLILTGLLFGFQTVARGKNKTIVAKQGEGIYTLLKRAGLPPGQYISEFREINKKKLGNDDHLIVGTEYSLPVLKSNKKNTKEDLLVEKDRVERNRDKQEKVAGRSSIKDKSSGLRKKKDTDEGAPASMNQKSKNVSDEKTTLNRKHKKSVVSKADNEDSSVADDAASVSDDDTPREKGKKGKHKKANDLSSDVREERALEMERDHDGVRRINGEDVKVKDHSLRGAIFYLKSGHGGPDPGAVCFNNGNMLCEDEYAYDIVIRLYQNLREHGARVYLIVRDPDDGVRDEEVLKPDNDEFCYPNDPIPLSQSTRLKQRVNAINRLYARHKDVPYQRLIAIHVDSRYENDNVDAFFYYDSKSKAGQQLANTFQETFIKKYDQYQPGRGYNGTVSERNLYVIKFSNPPGVFIEVGNINNEHDRVRLMRPENRQAVANWLTEGIEKDFQKNR